MRDRIPAPLPPAETPPLLEAWYRELLPLARFDISSSGVEAYGFAELRALTGLSNEDLDEVVLEDSVSFGAPRLRAALADRYAGGDASRVMATHGSSEAIALVLGALLNPGDRVVIVEPVYHSFRTIAEQRGCLLTEVPVGSLLSDADGVLDRALAPGARALIVNFPHNPTGATISDDRLEALLGKARRAGCVLVRDAAMAELPMDGTPPGRDAPADAVTFGTLSKAFGLPGLRVGWCVAPPALIERTLAARDRTTLFLSPLVELIAARSVRAADALIGPRLERARRNLGLLGEWIEKHRDFVGWVRPQGGVCGLIELAGVSDTEPFCRTLLERTGVLLVPGRAFNRPGAVRIGYGGPRAELIEGLARLSTALHAGR